MSEHAILSITGEDLETGDTERREIPKGDDGIVTTSPCSVSGTQSSPTKGTHVITVKGRTA